MRTTTDYDDATYTSPIPMSDVVYQRMLEDIGGGPWIQGVDVLPITCVYFAAGVGRDLLEMVGADPDVSPAALLHLAREIYPDIDRDRVCDVLDAYHRAYGLIEREP